MIFAERLRQRRKGRFSQEELAGLLKVHANTISRWESGLMIPKASKITQLASLLGTTRSYLLGDTDDPSPASIAAREHPSATRASTAHRITAKSTQKGVYTSKEVAELLPLQTLNGRLVYEWGGARDQGGFFRNRINLTDTPENRELYSSIVLKVGGTDGQE